jgi:hypothetical protein
MKYDGIRVTTYDSAPRSVLMVGESLAHYIVLEKAGAGGMTSTNYRHLADEIWLLEPAEKGRRRGTSKGTRIGIYRPGHVPTVSGRRLIIESV